MWRNRSSFSSQTILNQVWSFFMRLFSKCLAWKTNQKK
jgi:hypothetical protein